MYTQEGKADAGEEDSDVSNGGNEVPVHQQEKQGSKPIVTISELEVAQQISNTCAPSVLLTALRRLVVDSENSGFNLIDALAIDKDSTWIEKYRDEYDKHVADYRYECAGDSVGPHYQADCGS